MPDCSEEAEALQAAVYDAQQKAAVVATALQNYSEALDLVYEREMIVDNCLNGTLGMLQAPVTDSVTETDPRQAERDRKVEKKNRVFSRVMGFLGLLKI